MAEEATETAQAPTARRQATPADIAGLEERMARRLDGIGRRLDDMSDTLGAMAETLATPILAAETAALRLPADLPDAPEDRGEGFLSGLARKMESMEERAAAAVRSAVAGSGVEEEVYPDNGVRGAAAVRAGDGLPVAALADDAGADSLPIGPHARAIEERRAQAAHSVPGVAA